MPLGHQCGTTCIKKVTFDVTDEGADQPGNMNRGPDGILPRGGDTTEEGVNYECQDEENGQSDNLDYPEVPEYVGYLGDHIQNKSIVRTWRRPCVENNVLVWTMNYLDCQELLRLLGKVGAKGGKRRSPRRQCCNHGDPHGSFYGLTRATYHRPLLERAP